MKLGDWPARWFHAALFCAFTPVFLAASPAVASVTASISAGQSCGGASSVQYSPDGGAKKVALCVSTTSEKLCGVSYRLRVSSPAYDGQFQVTARQAGASYNELTPAPLPVSITSTPTGDLGAAPSPQVPVAAGTNQLVAILDITPSATATSSPYTISLDSPFSVALVDADSACGALGIDPTEAPLSAAITFIQGTAPQITSESSATFTVGFLGTFQLTAIGSPAPTLTIGGATLPGNVTFVPATGVLSGTPQLGTVGTYALTFTAGNGNLPNAVQNFSLTVQKANQAITFATIANRAYSATPFFVSASASSSLSVSFAAATPSICSVTGSQVTMLAAGACTINASQSGDLNYNPAATIPQTFTIAAVAPSAPIIGAATAGNGSATVSFSPPAATGGAPIVSYTAACGTQSATSAASPITVAGLTNGASVTCTVTAFNGTATSGPSSPSNSVTPIATYTVTPGAGTNGSIAPLLPVVVTQGATTSFTVTPSPGFVASVGGTCGGSLSGNTYTTAPITADCSVSATFVALVTYNVVLEGAQETPPNATTGTGSGTAVVDTVNNKITLNLVFSGMTGPLTGSHLHGPAVRGVAAGVKIGIGTTSPITDVVTYSEADEADILAGRWYVNLHTTANAGGEIRGQLDNLGAANKTLTVGVNGTGAGSVTGAGIACPGDCSESYVHNTMVNLAATPNTGSTFTGWSGACSGTGGCGVTMNALKSVTATFDVATHVVTSSAGANGTIAPAGIQTVNHGTVLIFTVTPAGGYTASVGGTCGGILVGTTFTTNAITTDCTVTAAFSAPLSLVKVESRKQHGAFTCNIEIDRAATLNGNVTVEPRDNSGGHMLVFVFDTNVTALGTVTVTPIGSVVSTTMVGPELQVLLAGIPDNSRVTVSASGVNGAVTESVSLGFLAGDISDTRAVTAADIARIKALGSQPISVTNCRADLNMDGLLKPNDISAIKARAGRSLQ